MANQNRAGTSRKQQDEALDDRGTTEQQGVELLQRLRDQGFESSNDKLALALGRPVKEVEGWLTGDELMDDDVVLKIRGIAEQRGISLE